MVEQEQERINFEVALELQRQLNEREEVLAEATQSKTIYWSDHVVLRYHALQNRPYSVAEVRKNMVMYLKNQAGYKQSYFKGMKYEEIRPIFEKVWDETHTFVPVDSKDKEKGSKKKARGSRKKTLAKKRADGSSKNYKIFNEMLDDFDRQDVLDLHMLVKARYMTSSPEGYDLMIWGDLKILFEPDEEDKVRKNQHEYNLISWRLFNSCGIHILLMNNGIAIHMMTKKKYPLNQEMLSRMLSKRLEVDHESTMAYELLKFIKSQNIVLVVKPHNKTPYELFHGRTPTLSFMRPFGCPVTILNTIDHLGKFDGKADEGLFIGYSFNSKAFRVFNSRTRIVEENLHIRFSENTPNVTESGPDWLFDINALTRTMNYEPIIAGIQSNGFAGTKASDNEGQARMETKPVKDYILLPLWTVGN
ncbi:ribonuclease H-like domain-containing protein [Tanacetum coccineum]|uniref:Ribonuclease H-like domain-containing protein n=1 Tax=Tanacetum coccineum TaxID=301880 RepID=A0ABQ5EKN6_9ASTR